MYAMWRRMDKLVFDHKTDTKNLYNPKILTIQNP